MNKDVLRALHERDNPKPTKQERREAKETKKWVTLGDNTTGDVMAWFEQGMAEFQREATLLSSAKPVYVGQPPSPQEPEPAWLQGVIEDE